MLSAKELRKNLELMRGAAKEEESKLVAYRNKTEGGVTIAECEARARFQCCNTLLAYLDDLVYEQNIEP